MTKWVSYSQLREYVEAKDGKEVRRLEWYISNYSPTSLYMFANIDIQPLSERERSLQVVNRHWCWTWTRNRTRNTSPRTVEVRGGSKAGCNGLLAVSGLSHPSLIIHRLLSMPIIPLHGLVYLPWLLCPNLWLIESCDRMYIWHRPKNFQQSFTISVHNMAFSPNIPMELAIPKNYEFNNDAWNHWQRGYPDFFKCHVPKDVKAKYNNATVFSLVRQ